MKNCKYCGEEFQPSPRGDACFVCKNGMYRYGLRRLDQIEMLDKQDNKCALCEKEVFLFEGRGKSGCVDHNHKTNTVRGILCQPCNTLLGLYESLNIDLNKINKYINKI